MKGFLSIMFFLMSLSVRAEKEDDVVVLTKDNFEHLTQAATGATTGPWLVEFYAPWCGHCKRLAPTFSKVATALKGEVSVAKVDVTENKELGARFGIRGYPTLKFFNQGFIYTYAGKRSEEDLIKFAQGGYKDAKSEAVPGIPSVQDAILREIQVIRNDFLGLVSTKKNVLLATFAAGIFIGGFFGYFCCCCCARSNASKKSKRE